MKAVKRLCVLFGTLVALISLLLSYQPNPKRDEPIVAIIFGYHFLLEKNSAEINYVRQVKKVLDSFSDVRFIVVSGGKTKPESSPYSEAENLKIALEGIGVKTPIVLEERAFSTEQNVRFSEEMIRNYDGTLPKNAQIVIFSDKARRQSVWWHIQNSFRGYRVSVFGIPLWKERVSYSLEARTMRNREKSNQYNFGTVDPGKLYRSAQPSPRFLETAARDYGIKTVISLRGETLNSEKMTARLLGLHLIEIPMSPDAQPSNASIEKFFEIVNDPKNQPVLLHCMAGSDRTGLLVAIYRMHTQKWCKEKAIAEMKRFGYVEFMHPGLIRKISEVTRCAK